MAVIVNLSTILTLRPDSTSIDKFAKICDSYAHGCLSGLRHASSFFKNPVHQVNYAWVKLQYRLKFNELIKPYEQGLITTPQFLQNLKSIFNFLDDVEELNAEDKQMLKEQANLFSTDPKLALLETAWTETIGIEEEHAARFPGLIEKNKDEPIYLISNTNELYVRKIIALLKQQNPSIKFFDPIDLSVKAESDTTPIEIAKNVFLCLSYRYGKFKTEDQHPPTTMSLMKHLVTQQLRLPLEQVEVISQFPGDLAEASALQISDWNIHTDTDYFASISPRQSMAAQ